MVQAAHAFVPVGQSLRVDTSFSYGDFQVWMNSTTPSFFWLRSCGIVKFTPSVINVLLLYTSGLLPVLQVGIQHWRADIFKRTEGNDKIPVVL